jgi:hypothetical protein
VVVILLTSLLIHWELTGIIVTWRYPSCQRWLPPVFVKRVVVLFCVALSNNYLKTRVYICGLKVSSLNCTSSELGWLFEVVDCQIITSRIKRFNFKKSKLVRSFSFDDETENWRYLISKSTADIIVNRCLWLQELFM